MSAGVQTSAIDVASLTVDEWFALDPEIDVVLVRKSDGVRITLCPNAECYEQHVARGEVVLSCKEIEHLMQAAREHGSEIHSLVARVIDAKSKLPGLRIHENWARRIE